MLRRTRDRDSRNLIIDDIGISSSSLFRSASYRMHAAIFHSYLSI